MRLRSTAGGKRGRGFFIFLAFLVVPREVTVLTETLGIVHLVRMLATPCPFGLCASVVTPAAHVLREMPPMPVRTPACARWILLLAVGFEQVGDAAHRSTFDFLDAFLVIRLGCKHPHFHFFFVHGRPSRRVSDWDGKSVFGLLQVCSRRQRHLFRLQRAQDALLGRLLSPETLHLVLQWRPHRLAAFLGLAHRTQSKGIET